MFSYYISTDIFKSTFETTIKHHIEFIQNNYKDFYLGKENDLRNFLNSIVLKDKENNRISIMNYEEIKQGKIRDDINFKNSFIKTAYDEIANATPIFLTVTLGSEYHPFLKNSINSNFYTDFKNKNSIDVEEMTNYFDKKIFEGYEKLNHFEKNFYKQRIFRSGGLTNNNRARILAYEPHKRLVAHLHKLEIVNDDYFYEYIKTFKNQHLKYSLGRCEVAIFERSFNEIKSKFSLKKINKTDYKIIDSEHTVNEYIYIRVLKDKSQNEVRSISNYLTNYLETNTVLLDDSVADNKEKNKKKSSIAYHAWAYYIAKLKDKFIPKEDGTEYKKIRRIRYSNLLVSKEVYRDIFNKELKQELELNGDYEKHNMYSKITELIKTETLKIYRIYRVDRYSIESSTGEILIESEKLMDICEPMYDKVMYYKLEYRGKNILIDNLKTIAYRFTDKDDFKKLEDLDNLEMLTKITQIDLKSDEWVFDRYRFENDKEELFDYDLK